ncbi:hypothetical protein GH5_07527 [Leishmania sp. Ghana 2012 LV757]|uniref:hypothetical protein n=1 Tax=Leishmania sp. Ghana 2012 LV757 TaxID=2803181 RepID=UPI001B5C47B3|nr:hypothetical protein GH5_07527 [Leishmania sp. Ghana 2012 LV757]
MSAPFPIRGEQRNSHSSATSTAVRDALCHRIRVLGASILAITQSAIKEAENLDDEYAEQQRRLSRRQPPRESSLRTVKVGAKASRSSKTGSTPPPRVALQPQRRARRPSSAEPGGSAPTPKHAASPTPSLPASGGSPSHLQSSGSSKKRLQHGKQSLTPARVGEAGAAVGTAAASASKETENLSKCSVKHAEENGAKRVREHVLHADVAVMALCAAAEANFQRVFAQQVPQDQQSLQSTSPSGAVNGASAVFCDNSCESGGGPCVWEHWCRGAPLYDLSNAAITSQYSQRVSGTEAFVDGEDDGAVPCNTSSGTLTTEVGGLASRTITVGGAAPLSARAFMSASELSHEAEQQALHALRILPHPLTEIVGAGGSNDAKLPEESNGCTLPQHEGSSSSSLSPARSYYRVVYIHQLRGVREVPSSGGDVGGADLGSTRWQGSDRACTVPYHPTPGVFSLGRPGHGATAEKVGEAPLRIASYVQAVYAVERADTVLSNPPPGSDSEAASLIIAAPAPVSGDAEMVQLKLRLPAQCSRENKGPTVKAASPMTTGAKPTAGTHSSSSTADRQADAATDAAASSSLPEAAENHNDAKAQPLKATKAAALGAAADAQIAARIESIKDWQRDRHADVEDRIRRQRRSPIVSAGWKGEYYYYTNSEGAAKAGERTGMPTACPASSPLLPDSVAATQAPSGAADSATTIKVSGELRDTSYQQQAQEHQDPQALSPPSVFASSTSAGKATTYAVLLPARQSTSLPLHSSNGARSGAATALSFDSDSGGASVQPPAQSSQNEPARSTVTAKAASAAAAGGGDGSGAASAATSTFFPESRPHPWLEVVVASSYSSIEWAFGGAARRASAAAPDSARSESLLLSASPLWAAHQTFEREWEEQRRWNARTRQPHGLDIHPPISIQIASRGS